MGAEKNFPLPVNGARGEVALWVGKVPLVIAAEIGRLASVSTALQCMSFVELYQRLLGVEVAATVEAVRHLAVKGDAAAAVGALKLSDFSACKNAFAAALQHHLGDDEGKGETVEEGATASETKPSPGEDGSPQQP